MQTAQQAPTESRFDFIITENRNGRKTTILTRGFNVKDYPLPRIPEKTFAEYCLSQNTVPVTQKELDKASQKYTKICQEYERFCNSFRNSLEANEMAMETNRILHNVMKKSAMLFLSMNYHGEETVTQTLNDVYDNSAEYNFQIVDRQNNNNIVANWSMSAAEYPNNSKYVPAFFSVWKDTDDSDGIRCIIRSYMDINVKNLTQLQTASNPYHLVSLEV